MLGDVEIYDLYLVGLGLCCLAMQGTFVFSEDIFSCSHISDGYGTVDHVIVFYIAILVLGEGSPDDPLYLTC